MKKLLLILSLFNFNSSTICSAQPKPTRRTPIQTINDYLKKIRSFSLLKLNHDMKLSLKWGNSFSYWRAINRQVEALQSIDEIEPSLKKYSSDLCWHFQTILTKLEIEMKKKLILTMH